MPPVHYKVTGWQFRVNFANCAYIAITQSVAHALFANKWWISYDIICWWPVSLSRVVVVVDSCSTRFVGDQLTRGWADPHANSIPDSYCLSVFVQSRLSSVVFDKGIPALNIFEIPKNGLWKIQAITQAVMPLQVA